jgi:hypothetical protein
MAKLQPMPPGYGMGDPYSGEMVTPPEPKQHEVEYYDKEGNLQKKLVPENELNTFYEDLKKSGTKLKQQDKILMQAPGKAPRKVVPGSKAHTSMLAKGWTEVTLDQMSGGGADFDFNKLRAKIKYEAEEAVLRGKATPEQERLLGLDDQYLNAALRILQPEMMLQTGKPTSYWTRRVGELADTLRHQMDVGKGRAKSGVKEYIFSPGKGLIQK